MKVWVFAARVVGQIENDKVVRQLLHVKVLHHIVRQIQHPKLQYAKTNDRKPRHITFTGNQSMKQNTHDRRTAQSFFEASLSFATLNVSGDFVTLAA